MSTVKHYRNRQSGWLIGASVLAMAGAILCGTLPARAQAMSDLRDQITEADAQRDLHSTDPKVRRKAQAAIRSGKVVKAKPGDPQAAPSQTQPTRYDPVNDNGLLPDPAADPNADPDNPDQQAGQDGEQPGASDEQDQSAHFTAIEPAPQPSDYNGDALPSERMRAKAKAKPGARPPSAAKIRTSDPDARDDNSASPGDDIATGRIQTIDTADREALVVDKGAEREQPIETGEIKREDDPYAPAGLRVGTFVMRPSIEEGITASTNPNLNHTPKSGIFSETTLRLNLFSDEPDNPTSLDGALTYSKSVSGEEIDTLQGAIAGESTYTLTNDYALKGAFTYSAQPNSASSPVEVGNVVSQPLNQSLTASLGLAKSIGPAVFTVTPRIERNWYGSAEIDDGTTLSQDDRNQTLAVVGLRAGYEVSPSLTPFVEVEGGRRLYDLEYDSAGYRRSANHVAARVGMSFDGDEKLGGEIAAGWLNENVDDERLGSVSGADVQANMRWSPVRGTTLGLRASTGVEGTTTAGEAGSLLHSATLTGERQVRSDLTLNGALGVSYRTYVGTGDHDLIYLAEVGSTWWLNRYFGLTTRLRYDKMDSTISGRDYDAKSVFFGIKVQQ